MHSSLPLLEKAIFINLLWVLPAFLDADTSIYIYIFIYPTYIVNQNSQRAVVKERLYSGERFANWGITASGGNGKCTPLRQSGGCLLYRKFPPRFPVGPILCKWGFWIPTALIDPNHALWFVVVEQFWLVCIDVNEDIIVQFLDGAGLSLLVKRQNQGFPPVVDSDGGVSKQSTVREAKSSFWGFSRYTEYLRNTGQQMAAALLFIIFGSSIDHWGSHQMNLSFWGPQHRRLHSLCNICTLYDSMSQR